MLMPSMRTWVLARPAAALPTTTPARALVLLERMLKLAPLDPEAEPAASCRTVVVQLVLP